MKRLVKKYQRTFAFGIVLLLIVAVLGIRNYMQEDRVFPVIQASEIELGTSIADLSEMLENTLPSYTGWRQAHAVEQKLAEQYAKEADGLELIKVAAVSYSAIADGGQIAKRQDDERGEVIDWQGSGGWVEWEIDVAVGGLYAIEMEYQPLTGSYANVVRGIQIDGEYPYQEAERFVLERLWRDSQYPYDRNGLGNEIRPVQVEEKGWRHAEVTNYAASSEALLWLLAEGKHTIRLTEGREPVSIASVTLKAAKQMPDYEQYASLATRQPDTESDNWHIQVEAEQYKTKSAVGVQTQSVAEAFMSPDPKGRLVYNTIGGDRWQNAGDWIEWAFEVPASGWYAFDLKYMQGYNGKANVYRTIMIDGQVPFHEMLHYSFPASSNMAIHTLADQNGNPYKLWLEQGEHRIRLIADSSLLAPAVEALRGALVDLSAIEREIRLITGNYNTSASAESDTGRTWQLTSYVPQLDQQLMELYERFRIVRDYINGLHQNVTDATSAISSTMDRLQRMSSDIDKIPNTMSEFADIQTSINTWLKPLESQPLLLDFLVVRQANAAVDFRLPGKWDQVRYSVANFARTFFQSYDLKDLNDDQAITVWVQRGRDYVDLLQKMIESDFTPVTGIHVNVNLMPSTNVLMLGNAAGDQPDIALGVGMEIPADYAMRGAVADLSEMEGFEEVLQRFNPGVMRSYVYDGGVYGLPETQSFMVMFYRTDVLDRLGLSPPDTWDDLINMLPTLQENGMDIYYPAKEFVTPFYQRGAEFFTQDGMETAIDSKEGQEAFRWWTELFSTYNMPKEVPAFFNHFRYGDIPIGIADYNTYIQLTVAAPEIAGKWKMAPLPGFMNEDGQVVRWSAQTTTAALLMEKGERKADAWAFLKWWTSAETQAKYANDIESFAGIEYRWNPATIEALQYVPWPTEDMDVLAEQGSWGKNMPYVPGYYFLSREMDFAWNNTVLLGMPPKEALRKAAISLQREMARKQKEFGLEEGSSLKLPEWLNTGLQLQKGEDGSGR